MAKALAVQSNILDDKATKLDSQVAAAFGQRVRDRAEELTLSSSDISRLSGIPKQSMTGYWTGARLCGSDRLFPLSDALRVNARWLASGDGPKTGGGPLIDAADADFVGLPAFDLQQVTEAGRGNRIDTIPFRRDWLNRRVGTASGLWIAELPSTYEELGLVEGDAVICSDLARNEVPPDNTTCIFLGDGLFVARYRNHWIYEPGDTAGPRIGPADLADGMVQPIARIRARLLSTL